MSRKGKRLRVVVLMHEDLIPPDDIAGMSESEVAPFKTEYDVCTGLDWLGHEVVKLGLHDEIAPLRETIKRTKPHVVFNLLEEFHGQTVYDQHVVSYLELARQAYSGCNPRGLVLGRDKALSKKILAYHRIRVPRFFVYPKGRKLKRPARMQFPLIVKSLIEEGSTGISEASVVCNDHKLEERVAFIHRTVQTDAIVEQYIDGRELYAGVLGNVRLKVFPPWELTIKDLRGGAPMLATSSVKWNASYQERRGVDIGPAAELSAQQLREFENTTKRIYRILGLSGYARIDYRLSPSGSLYFLEANPNPDVALEEEYVSAAKAAGISYEDLLQRILSLGISWMKRRA